MDLIRSLGISERPYKVCNHRIIIQVNPRNPKEIMKNFIEKAQVGEKLICCYFRDVIFHTSVYIPKITTNLNLFQTLRYPVSYSILSLP